MSKTLPIVVCLVWIGMSLTFFGYSSIADGAAISGKIVGTHYYLGTHGHYSEVSRGKYVFSAVLSGAFALSGSLFAVVMTLHESRKPGFSRFHWFFPIFFSLIALGFCCASAQCVLNAFWGTGSWIRAWIVLFPCMLITAVIVIMFGRDEPKISKNDAV